MEWVPVGRVTKTHGLKGELKFVPFMDEREIYRDFKRAALYKEDDKKGEYAVQSVRGAGSVFIIKFEGSDSIEAAKPLCGTVMFVPRGDLKPLPEGEYYRFEIEGLRVYDEAGKYYGCIEEIIETGSNDVYVVRDGKKETLLPMIESVVKTVDLKERKLIFHIVEGLLEDTPV